MLTGLLSVGGRLIFCRWLVASGGRWFTVNRVQYKCWLSGNNFASIGNTVEVDRWHAVGTVQGIRVEQLYSLLPRISIFP